MALEDPLLINGDGPQIEQPPVEDKSMIRSALRYLGWVAICCLIFSLVVQYASYSLARHGCSPAALEGVTSKFGYDLLPTSVLLVQEHHVLWNAFAVFPGSEDGLITGAALGYFFSIWGPWKRHYGFTSIAGHNLVAIEPDFFAVGFSTSISRCDELEATYLAYEGISVIANWFRKRLGLFTSSEYHISRDGQVVSKSNRVGFSSKQLVLETPEGDMQGEAVLKTRKFRGDLDEWYIRAFPTPGSLDTDPIEAMPANGIPSYVVTSISALFAFHEEKPDVPVDNKVLAQLQEGKNPLTLLSAYEAPTQVAEGLSNQPEAL